MRIEMVHFEKCQKGTFECFFRVISLFFPKLITGQNDQKFIRSFTVMEFAFSIKKKRFRKRKQVSLQMQTVQQGGWSRTQDFPFSPVRSASVGLGSNWNTRLETAEPRGCIVGLSSGSSRWPALGFHPPLPHFLSL